MIETSLTVGNQVFKGWKSVQAALAIDAIAGEFSISAAQTGGVMLYPGQEMVFKIANQTVSSGYIHGVNAHVSADDDSLSLRGADKTIDLAQCSAVHEQDEWFNLNLTEIATKLCKPFGICVQTLTNQIGESFKVFKIQPGETAFDALDRAAKARAVLVSSNNQGDLILTRAGDGGFVDDLIYGENILEADVSYDWSNRFSKYVVKNQTPMIDETKSNANTVGNSQDLDVSRYRPMLMIAQNSESGVSVSELAAWEASVRAGNSASVNITVEGCLQRSGQLWKKNALSRVYLPRYGIDAKMLVKQVSFEIGDNGAKTRLSLVRPDAYKRLPVVSKSADKGGLLPPDAIEVK